ncbi:Phytosulfokine precursor protein (PSK) [Ranunculus cassubicifolius]
MKGSLYTRHQWLLILLVLLVLCSHLTSAAARMLQDDNKVVSGGLFKDSVGEETEEDDTIDLMGVEYCGNGDEECIKRRMVAEAHLDYIYTQQHKP